MGISTLAVRMLAEPLRTLAAGSISGAYMGIGTGIDNPSRIIFVQNLTDAQLTFSIDGVNDHFVLPSSSFILLDTTANQSLTQGIYFAVGTRVYVKGSPGTGSVYVSTFYGSTL